MEQIFQTTVFGALCEQVTACHVSKACSQFEVTLAIALLYFVEQKCELVFLETGLGGLLDATNVIKDPLVSMITSISVDHMRDSGKYTAGNCRNPKSRHHQGTLSGCGITGQSRIGAFHHAGNRC